MFVYWEDKEQLISLPNLWTKRFKTLLVFTQELPKDWLFSLLSNIHLVIDSGSLLSSLSALIYTPLLPLKLWNNSYIQKRIDIYVRYMLSRKIQLPISSEDSHFENDTDHHSAQQNSEPTDLSSLEFPRRTQHISHQLEQGVPHTQEKIHGKVSTGSVHESPMASKSLLIVNTAAHIPLSCRWTPCSSPQKADILVGPVSYTHLRAHET